MFVGSSKVFKHISRSLHKLIVWHNNIRLHIISSRSRFMPPIFCYFAMGSLSIWWGISALEINKNNWIHIFIVNVIFETGRASKFADERILSLCINRRPPCCFLRYASWKAAIRTCCLKVAESVRVKSFSLWIRSEYKRWNKFDRQILSLVFANSRHIQCNS